MGRVVMVENPSESELVSLHYDGLATSSVDEVADFSSPQHFADCEILHANNAVFDGSSLPRIDPFSTLQRQFALRRELVVPDGSETDRSCDRRSQPPPVPSLRAHGGPQNRYNPAHHARDRDFTIAVGSAA